MNFGAALCPDGGSSPHARRMIGKRNTAGGFFSGLKKRGCGNESPHPDNVSITEKKNYFAAGAGAAAAFLSSAFFSAFLSAFLSAFFSASSFLSAFFASFFVGLLLGSLAFFRPSSQPSRLLLGLLLSLRGSGRCGGCCLLGCDCGRAEQENQCDCPYHETFHLTSSSLVFVFPISPLSRQPADRRGTAHITLIHHCQGVKTCSVRLFRDRRRLLSGTFTSFVHPFSVSGPPSSLPAPPGSGCSGRPFRDS